MPHLWRTYQQDFLLIAMHLLIFLALVVMLIIQPARELPGTDLFTPIALIGLLIVLLSGSLFTFNLIKKIKKAEQEHQQEITQPRQRE